jgi:SWI/SNF-related matrix-associated actin-dependent regulator of chromatin subfamily A member 5
MTLSVNIKRVALEAARRTWLHRHRRLFEPLLPQGSSFVTNSQKELEILNKATYVARRAVEEQPKLIEGGTMKDYQVSMSCYTLFSCMTSQPQLEGLSFLSWMYNNGSVL